MYSALAARSHPGRRHPATLSNGKGQPRPHKPMPRRAASRPLQMVWQKRTHNSSLAAALASDPNSKKMRKTGKVEPNRQPLAPSPQPCKVWLGPSRVKLGNHHSAGNGLVSPGSVFESDFEHVKRHRAEGQAHKCLRCIYLSNPRALEQNARLPLTSHHMATWLEPAPRYKGGTWGLGCRICAWHLSTRFERDKGQPLAAPNGEPARKHKKKLFKDPKLQKRSQPRFSKLSGFGWRRPNSITKNIKQHGTSQAHEIACKAMAQKENGLESLSRVGATGAPPAIDPVAQQIFKGRVPKPVDWLECFVETNNIVSWRKQARIRIGNSGQTSVEPLDEPKAPKPDCPTAAPTHPSKSQPLAARRTVTCDSLRKTRRKQTRMMAEVVRRRHRQVLKKAKFCSLALDEAQGRKLVHFRCDYHKAPWYYQGTLGVFKMGSKTMEEGEQDHALRAMRRLDEFLSGFCTPLRKASLGTQCDEDMKKHLLKIVVTISADGGSAERRAIFLACEPGLHSSWEFLGPPSSSFVSHVCSMTCFGKSPFPCTFGFLPTRHLNKMDSPQS